MSFSQMVWPVLFQGEALSVSHRAYRTCLENRDVVKRVLHTREGFFNSSSPYSTWMVVHLELTELLLCFQPPP